jgi:hypothetical protein
MQPLIPTQLQLTAQQRVQILGLALRDRRGLSEVARETIDLYLLDRPAPRAGPDELAPVPTASAGGSWERA